MNRPNGWFVNLLLAAAVAGATYASPPTATYLAPDRHVAGLGEAVELRFVAGAAKDAPATRWPSDQGKLMLVRSGGTQQNRHAVRPARDTDNFVKVDIVQPGVTVIGVDQQPVLLDMTGAELRTFVERNVGDAVAIEKAGALKDDQKLHVRHFASAKTLIRVPAEKGGLRPSALATSKTTLTVELRLGLDPTAVKVGSDVPLTVYIDGIKKEGIKIEATNIAACKTSAFHAVGAGTGYFPLTDAGIWRVAFEHAEPVTDDPAADWAIYSGTLTFEAAKGAGQ